MPQITQEEKMRRFIEALSHTVKLPDDMKAVSYDLLTHNIINWSAEQTMINEGVLSYK